MIGPADQLLLGRSERDDDAARNVVAHHRLFDREGRGGGKAAMGVVALHVAGAAGDERLAREFHRGLRTARQRIDLADDGDGRMSGSPARPQIGRHAGGAELDREAGILEHALHQSGALELLHAELGEIVDRVADLGGRLRIAVDDVPGELLLLVACRLAGQRHKQPKQRKQHQLAGHRYLPGPPIGLHVPYVMKAYSEPENRRNAKSMAVAAWQSSDRPAVVASGSGR